MKFTVEYHNNEDYTILTKVFKGNVNRSDIIQSWKEVMKSELISKTHRGVISDMREANLYHEKTNTEKLHNFFSKNIDFFKNLKLAIVIDSPEVVYPMIFETEQKMININYFCTIEAAKNWVQK